jgi:hypothetical protein
MTQIEKGAPRLPNNHVLAVISGTIAARQAAETLAREGFPDAEVFEGTEFAEKVDAKGNNSGLVAKVVKSVEDHLSDETNYLMQYEEEARRGNEVIAVPVPKKEDAEKIRDILIRHNARNVRYFGHLAVSDLSGENPSARSDAPGSVSPENWQPGPEQAP